MLLLSNISCLVNIAVYSYLLRINAVSTFHVHDNPKNNTYK